MKSIAMFSSLFLLTATLLTAQKESTSSIQYRLSSLHDSLGYQAGWQFGLAVKREGADVNTAILIAGVRDALTYSSPRLTLAQVDNLLEGVRNKLDQMIEDQDTTGNIPLRLYGKSSKNGPDNITTPNDSLSYAIGYNYGLGVKEQRLPYSRLAVVEGVTHCLYDKESLLTKNDKLQLEIHKQQERITRQNERMLVAQAEKDFLEKNRGRPEVKRLPSGIHYEVLNPGQGESAAIEDQVTIHLTASKLNEEPYFDTYRTDQPLVYKVSEVSEEWVTILTWMPVGARWKLWIPPDVAFGTNFSGEVIPQTIEVEVEVISISSSEE